MNEMEMTETLTGAQRRAARSQYDKDYYAKNREKRLAANKVYRTANKDRLSVKASRAASKNKRAGLKGAVQRFRAGQPWADMFYRAKGRAKAAGVAFNLTKEEVGQAYLKAKELGLRRLMLVRLDPALPFQADNIEIRDKAQVLSEAFMADKAVVRGQEKRTLRAFMSTEASSGSVEVQLVKRPVEGPLCRHGNIKVECTDEACQ